MEMNESDFGDAFELWNWKMEFDGMNLDFI